MPDQAAQSLKVDAASESPIPFADDSMVRRVHREAIVLGGGGRALLMQIAHPSVAAGVAEHSSFRAAPFRRLLRTLQPTLAIAFGNAREALAAAHSINEAHGRVVGPGYSARDPDLLFWVLATLIDSALLVHARFLRPLAVAEREAYYRDMLTAGELLGVDRARAPRDFAAFESYMDSMVAALEVTPLARRLAHEIFGPPLAWTPFGPVTKWLTAGLLPTRLRDQFGLRWGPRDEQVLDALTSVTRTLLPGLPPPLRAQPWFLMPDSQRPPWLRRRRTRTGSRSH